MSTGSVTSATSQAVRGERFRALHHQPGAFIIPNPWDAGSARLLTQIGFDALASTGAGCAFSAGQPDGSVGRDPMLSHLRALAEATDLPISADLQDGFGDEPDVVAETIELVAACGIVGGSIEDRSYRPGADLLAGRALHDLGLAVERIQAASEAARRLPFAFTLTARCEGSVAGQADLDHVVRRLLAYQDAGADVLYAPGLTGRDEIAAVVAAVDRPVNVVMGLVGDPLALDELSELGVKRVSLGSTLCRVALGALMRAARELRDAGTFTFASEAIGYTTVNRLLAGAAGASG